MLEKGVSPDSRTFVVALQVCGMLAEKEDAVTVKGDLVKSRSLKMGKEMHARAQRNGSDRGFFVGSSLIGMYGKCGSVVDARHVFEALSERNMVCWTVMLAAYVQQGQALEALKLYKQMQEEGLSPDIRTYASAIQACGKLAEVEQGIPGNQQSNYADKGKAVHARAWRKGYDMDVVVGSALTSMYAKCGTILDAQIVFDRILQRDVVAWTVLVMAYVEHGQPEKALCLYEQMQEEGVSANTWTFVSVLHGCCRLAEMEETVTMDGAVFKPKSLVKGKAIHADARRKSYDTDAFVANTLVAMYGKCGIILDAENVFFMLSRQTVVAWTAMVATYVEHDCAEKAVQLYEQMQAQGSTPDEVAIVWVLQAYSTIGSLPNVRHIHHNLVSGRNELTPILAATLVTAYGKCSSLVDAQSVFDEVRKPSVVLWTALIAAYARQGKSVASLQCYEDMRLAGVKPDDVTFLSLLSACGHAGLTDQGILYFESMSKDFGIAPKIEHFVSMVDLLGRAGCFSRLKDLLSVMPMQPTLAMWLCILGACRKHGKVVLGEQAFSCAVRLQPEHSAAFVLMSNIYADAGLFEHAERVREQEVAVKKPGQSWIEHEQVVHTFLVQDRKHAQHRQVYDLLWNAGLKLNREGHIPHTPNVLNTMGQGPEESLHGYVDQLALVSGHVGRALRGL